MPESSCPIILARFGETPRSIASQLSRHASISGDDALAVLCANNGIRPDSPHCGGQPLWIGPQPLKASDPWFRERDAIARAFEGSPDAARLAREDPWLLYQLDRVAERANEHGWLTGQRFSELGGYGAGAISAYSGVLNKQLRVIAQLADEVYVDSLRALGPSRSPFGVSRSQRSSLERILRANPRYGQLRSALGALPRYVRQGLGDLEIPRGPHANASFFRRQFVVPRGVHAGAHLGRVSRRLGREVLRSARAGRAFTWVVPAALGIYNSATAHPGQRARVAAGETVGIIMGAGGAKIGAIGAGMGLLALSSVVAVPGAVAFVVLVVATAVSGYAGYSFGKSQGEYSYDLIADSVSHLADWFVEAF